VLGKQLHDYTIEKVSMGGALARARICMYHMTSSGIDLGSCIIFLFLAQKVQPVHNMKINCLLSILYTNIFQEQ
jgi:hypothetical protein